MKVYDEIDELAATASMLFSYHKMLCERYGKKGADARIDYICKAVKMTAEEIRTANEEHKREDPVAYALASSVADKIVKEWFR